MIVNIQFVIYISFAVQEFLQKNAKFSLILSIYLKLLKTSESLNLSLVYFIHFESPPNLILKMV